MIDELTESLWYLTGGLLALWFLLAGYVGLLSLRLRRAERGLARLEGETGSDG
jgi:hypothetical protein